MKKTLSLTLVALAIFSQLAFGAVRNDIPSCYDYAGLSEYKPSVAKRELFVVVDQTLHLDSNMKVNVHKQVQSFNQPGDKITVVTFSAMAAGEYTNIPFSGYFETPLSSSDRDSVNRTKLTKLDSCLKSQAKAVNGAQKMLKESFNDGDEDYPKTELAGTIMSIGTDLISRSQADKKIVFLVSDMLENSETLTFYSRGHVNVPDAQKAFEKIAAQGFQADFKGADLHVLGAGYIHGGKNYSSYNSMKNLEQFWRMVLKDSNVNLVQFGKPNLLRNISG
ncbi:hypothetical protein I7Z51_002389 [Vibrio parahaemolyticus]|uniref:hypothetical protein n=1 Tax=Vibrio TaxID=662 RepID=UPI001A8C9BD3|nr:MULTISPECIES: hypothetical protein [Vibrio]EGQ7973467.1 hypothetical protein [Vibrio parahaemolyticus]MBO0208631.1 hypothetical protein [Vibrio sp. Vb0877]MCR9810906.1 hypothetical protein [Vibrio parahaemolyticus]